MKKLKIFIYFIYLKLHGYDKANRMTFYAINNLITFEEYERYFDYLIKK